MLGKQGAAKPDEIGPWSEEKLQLLGSYLKAYSDIMNAKKREWLQRYHYIDAFAGSVYPKPKELNIANRQPVNGPRLWTEEPVTNPEDDIETTRYISGSP